MQAIFRVDSSLQIGAGHVVRCLALAQVFRNNGLNVRFICRKHSGNLIENINFNGFKVYELEAPKKTESSDRLTYSQWLGVTQEQDADDCINILKLERIDLFIVDHYAIDSKWHNKIKPFVEKLIVIDDLANRRLDCDVLINQNLGVNIDDYQGKIPENCNFLLGSEYALLRSEFLNLRAKALEKRKITKKVKNILISVGGSDMENLTYDILKKINKDFNIVVVLGSSSPHNEIVQNYAQDKNIEVIINANNMADLMLHADLAIGSSGSTSWERCCLGLPTLLFVVGADQEKISYNLEVLGAAKVVKDLEVDLNNLSSNITLWKDMSSKAANICDGSGSSKVAKLCLL